MNKETHGNSIIRRASEQDIDGIMNLLAQVLMVHHNGRPDLFKAHTSKYTPDQLSDILKNDDTPVFVSLDDNGKVQGHAFCILKQAVNDNILTDVKTLYIDDICVDENCRKGGVGRSLYEYVLSYAKEIGCYNITLNVWSCNTGAMKFYEKCGLVPQKVGMEKIL